MKRAMNLAMIMAMAAMLCGCDELSHYTSEPASLAPPPAEGEASYLRKTTVRADPQTEGPSAVESALAWSQKYAELSERHVEVQNTKESLERQNRDLLANVAKLQTELEQTQKELAEANTMLISMREQLDSWKSNVLGFREEIRQAEHAQIEALRKVIDLLGGELQPAEPTATKPEPAKPSPSEQANQNEKTENEPSA